MKTVTLYANSSPASIAALQDGGAGALILATTAAALSTTNPQLQSGVSINSLDDISGVTFTIRGLDGAGVAIEDTVTGVNANTVDSFYSFASVTSIEADAPYTNVTVTWSLIGVSIPFVIDRHLSVLNLFAKLIPQGSTASLEYTFQDVWNLADDANGLISSQDYDWIPITAFQDKAVTTEGAITTPYMALRLSVSVYVGPTYVELTQMGGPQS